MNKNKKEKEDLFIFFRKNGINFNFTFPYFSFAKLELIMNTELLFFIRKSTKHIYFWVSWSLWIF